MCEVTRNVYADESDQLDMDMKKLKNIYLRSPMKSHPIKLVSITKGMFFGHEILNENCK